MTIEKTKSIEIKIDLSKQLFGAGITLMGFQSALLLFVLEKKEGEWYFYLTSLIAFICLIVSLIYSGLGIDKQAAILAEKEVDKKSDPFSIQVLFAFSGIAFFILSIAASILLPVKKGEKEDKSCCCNIIMHTDSIKGNTIIQEPLSLIANIGPFSSGNTSLQNSNEVQFNKIRTLILNERYVEIFIFGGVDKRPLKGNAEKYFGDNLTLAQARANVIKDSIENYINKINLTQKPPIFICTNGGAYYGSDITILANDRHVKVYGRKIN